MNSENTNNQSNSFSGEISLKDLLLKIGEWWQYLLSKWWLILICGLIGGGLGYAYAYSKKPVYTATTTFVLEDSGSSSGGLGNLGGLASMVGMDLGGSNGGIFQGDNILELYKSRIMIEKTLLTPVIHDGKKELIIDYFIRFNKLREEDWNNNSQLKKIKFEQASDDFLRPNLTRIQDSILGGIVNDIGLNYLVVSKPNKKLSIIRADVSSKDEFFSKIFNDAIVDNVNKFYIRTKTKKSLQSVNILQEKTDSVRSVMNGAIYSAAIISDATPNLNPTRQVQRVAPVQRSQFNAEANKTVLTQLLTNLELSKMSLLKETPLIQVVDRPVFPLNKEVYGKKKWLIIGFLLGCIAVGTFYSLKLIIRSIMT